MPKTNKIRTHFLKNCDLPSLLEPAPAHEATWTATKGTRAQSMLGLSQIWPLKSSIDADGIMGDIFHLS